MSDGPVRRLLRQSGLETPEVGFNQFYPKSVYLRYSRWTSISRAGMMRRSECRRNPGDSTFYIGNNPTF